MDPLTPQQKIEYLASKLEATIAEVRATTGLDITVGLMVNDTFDSEQKGLATAAEGLGFVSHEWSNCDKGGSWVYEHTHGDIRLIDSELPHAPKLSPIDTGPEDQHVLGFEGAVESLVSQ